MAFKQNQSRFQQRLFHMVAGVATLATTSMLAGNAFALSVKELERYLSTNLSTHLPITFIGPLVAPNISVAEVENGFSVFIPETEFLTGEKVGDFTFKMMSREDGNYDITDVELPREMTSIDGELYPIAKHELNGVWSISESAYVTIDYALEGMTYVTADSETTFTKLNLLIEPQKQDGTQSFSFNLGPTSLVDTEDGDTVIFDGIKAAGNVKSEENLMPYRFLGGLFDRLAQDGSKILQDQSELLNILSPMYVPYDSANMSIATGKLVMEKPDEGEKFTIDSLTFNSDAKGLLDGKSGHSDFDLILKGIQFNNRKNAVALSKLRVFAGSDEIDGAHAFKYGREYLALLADEDAEIDLADVFDLYMNFDDFGMQVELEDFSLAAGDGTNIELGETSFGGQLLGLRSDQADMLLNVSHKDIEVSGVNEELIKALMPEKSKLVFRLDDVPMSQVKEGLRGSKVPVSLISGDDKALGEFMRTLGFQLLSILLSQPPKLQIEDSYLDTPSVKTRLEGTFEVAPMSSKLVAGHVDVYASGLKDLQKAAVASLRSASGRTKKVALGLFGGLGIAQGFGKKQDDGSLLYKVSMDQEGVIKVNNLPVPKF